MSPFQAFTRCGHTIIWGDALEVLASEVRNSSVELIFVDPPYNIGKNFVGRPDKWPSQEAYLRWCYRWLQLCIEKLKPYGTMYVMAATQNMPYFDIFLRSRLTILSRIVWHYDSSGVQARAHFGSLYEPILHCVKDKKRYTFNAQDILVEARTGAVRRLIDYRRRPPKIYNSKKVPGNVWQIARVRYRMGEYENHPTQKPVGLVQRIIRASSNVGETVLDPFSGTFTTSFVAKQLNRKSIGIEVEEEYVKIGLRRLGIMLEYKGERLLRPARSTARRPRERQIKLQLEER